MKRSNVLIVLMFMLATNFAIGQCTIKMADQNSDHMTYYLDPELVAQTSNMGAAISVQSIEGKYYLAITYQFANKAVPLEEKVAIELMNSYTLELEMYTMQGMNARGIELILAVFNMTDDQIKYFTASDMKAIHFATQNGEKKKLVVTSNADALKRQLKCFGK